MIKKYFYCLIVVTFLVSIFLSDDAISAQKKKGAILTNADIKDNYEILGIVVYQSSGVDLNKVNQELKKQAEAMGADYVVGVSYFSGFGYIYGSGTAVKLIEKD